MSSELKKASCSSMKKLFDSTVEITPELETVLPDFCSDIRKILKCNCKPGVISVQRTGDRITADGESLITLIYVNDNGYLDSYSTTIPFTRFIEAQELPENIITTVSCKTEYLNCRAIGQRRISVNGKVYVRFEIKCALCSECICEAVGDGIQAKKESIDFFSIVSVGSKLFDLNETISLNDSEPSVGSIVHCESFIKKESVKVVNGKVLVKGAVSSRIYYISDDEEHRMICREHSMPLSQIVEASGVNEKSDCEVLISESFCSVEPQTDSSGSKRMLEISYKLTASVSCSTKTSGEVITDCFGTDCEIEPEYRTDEFIIGRNLIRESKTEKCSIDVPMNNDSSVHCFWCREITNVCNCSGSTYECNCCAVICIIYTDDQGLYTYIEKPVDIKLSGPLAQDDEETRCVCNASLSSLSCMKSSDGKIDVSVCTDLEIISEHIRKMRICTDIDVKNDVHVDKKSFLTVRYCEAGESIWDIASTYKTSVESIKKENCIESDCTEEKCILIIPG